MGGSFHLDTVMAIEHLNHVLGQIRSRSGAAGFTLRILVVDFHFFHEIADRVRAKVGIGNGGFEFAFVIRLIFREGEAFIPVDNSDTSLLDSSGGVTDPMQNAAVPSEPHKVASP